MTQNIGLYCINPVFNKNRQEPKGRNGEKYDMSDPYINADTEAVSAPDWFLTNIIKAIMTES